jgi:hypothetical protein
MASVMLICLMRECLQLTCGYWVLLVNEHTQNLKVLTKTQNKNLHRLKLLVENKFLKN